MHRQLRRFQSLLHPLGGNKQTSHAMTYPLDLWRSILQLTGFDEGFVA